MLKYYIKSYIINFETRKESQGFCVRNSGRIAYTDDKIIEYSFDKSEPYYKTFKNAKHTYDMKMSNAKQYNAYKSIGEYITYSIIEYNDISNQIREIYKPDYLKFVLESYDDYIEYRKKHKK